MGATGSGVGSFAGGFAKGLSQALVINRERKDRETNAARDLEWKKFQALLPTFMENATGSQGEIDAFIAQFPHIAASVGTTTQGGKKTGESAWEKYLGPIMRWYRPGAGKQPMDENPASGTMERAGVTIGSPSPIGGPMLPIPRPSPGMLPPGKGDVNAGAGTALPATITPPGTTNTPPAAMPAEIGLPSQIPSLNFGQDTIAAAAGPSAMTVPGAPGSPTPAPTTPRPTLMGVPIFSHDEQLQRGIDDYGKQTVAKIELARSRILPALKAADPSATLDDALRVIGVTIPRDGSDSVYHYGVNREALAQSMFGRNYGALNPGEQSKVLEAEQKYLNDAAKSRGAGSATAKFEAPITIPEAQASGLPVGTTAADVSGQTVQPQNVQADMRTMQTLKADITHIQDLIAVLPSEADLGGMAPGAVSWARAQMNSSSPLLDDNKQPISYRDAYAQLSSNLDTIVNALARTLGQARGTQTERDAERAYNALVNLKASLTSPLGGDTRESAAKRITETLAALDRVMAQMPGQAVPKKDEKGAKPGATSAPAPAAGSAPAPAPKTGGTNPAAASGPAGVTTDAKGNIYVNGQLTIPAQ